MGLGRHGGLGQRIASHYPAARLARGGSGRRGEGTSPHLAALQPKLERYFRGEDVSFQDEALDIQEASSFLAHVWDVVRAIPRGQVRSYGWVAQQVGSPHGARAVGLAMAINPFPIVVPCHRVVGKHGQLTGFGGGLEMKSRLLAMEGVRLSTE
jgi:methylated-DNA-[protein]-cysteine S-methyltransferase